MNPAADPSVYAEVTLGGTVWTFYRVPPDAKVLEGCNGIIPDPCTSAVFMRNDLGVSQTEAVFIHELLHACLYESGASFVLETACKSGRFDDTEEAIIRALAPMLHQVQSQKVVGAT